MKLNDFLADNRLNSLRITMGAERLGNFSSNKTGRGMTALDLEALIGTGIDIEDLADVLIHDDHTLEFKGKRVILYIRDIPEPEGEIDPLNLPKFHIANCSTLVNMRSQKRYGRYVVAARDDGLFHVNFKNYETGAIRKSLEKLNVCKNCLKEISFDGYRPSLPASKKSKIVADFKISDFFMRWPRDLVSGVGVPSAELAPQNDYTGDFGYHSYFVKVQAAWSCSSCRRYLGAIQDRRYLHAHHVNGIKYDNSEENLQVLCIACHSEQFGHGHMKSLPEYKEYISR